MLKLYLSVNISYVINWVPNTFQTLKCGRDELLLLKKLSIDLMPSFQLCTRPDFTISKSHSK